MLDINILYEDEDILVVDKPAGVLVHEGGRVKEETVADWFVSFYPHSKGVGEPISVGGVLVEKPGVVHRLDKDTSGVLLLAKTNKAFSYLKEQFSRASTILKEKGVKALMKDVKKVNKKYLAIVEGFMKDDYGSVDKPIGRSPSNFRRRLAGRGARGRLREAVTNYKTLERFVDESGNKFSLIEVSLLTGRTHQIRVHMKYLNRPIVGDSLYNPDGLKLKGVDRMALHAKSIDFVNLEGKRIRIESPTPSEFKVLPTKA